MSKILITGFSGCIGSATVDYLFSQGVEQVVGLSRTGVKDRLSEDAAGRIVVEQVDISDVIALEAMFKKYRPDAIVHLAALQTPDCQSHPFWGMDVNLSGTVNLFKAAALLGSDLQRLVFASSAAVYGPRAIYAGTTVSPSDPYAPVNLYGYWKTAGEGMAQAYHMETGVPTVSIRLSTTYGPGRDKGLTSAPTTAMKAVAAGEAFEIPYDGREQYHYVKDVGAGFAQCAIEEFDDYGVFNLRGETIRTSEFVERLSDVAGELGMSSQVKVADNPMEYPFACDLSEVETLKAFPKMPKTDMRDGIRESLKFFAGK